jgi:hypothetical protein
MNFLESLIIALSMNMTILQDLKTLDDNFQRCSCFEWFLSLLKYSGFLFRQLRLLNTWQVCRRTWKANAAFYTCSLDHKTSSHAVVLTKPPRQHHSRQRIHVTRPPPCKTINCSVLLHLTCPKAMMSSLPRLRRPLAFGRLYIFKKTDRKCMETSLLQTLNFSKCIN